MRVRAIIEGRYAWRDEGPGNGAAGASGYHGSIVQGEPGANAHRKNARQRETRVHAPKTRTLAWWRGAPPCGVLMPRIQQPCARHAGHSDTHRSAVTIATDAARRAADQTKTVAA